MLVMPSIDVEAGVAVKRIQGVPGTGSRIGDPREVLSRVKTGGYPWVHIVDLDGASRGRPSRYSMELVEEARGMGLKVEYGGGVRSIESAAEACGRGASRLVIGTRWVEDPGFLVDVKRYTGCEVLAAVEVGEDLVLRIGGWGRRSGVTLEDALYTLKPLDVDGVLFTYIPGEGRGRIAPQGLVLSVRSLVKGVLVYSGGVRSTIDLDMLKSSGVDAVVVGSALYNGWIEWGVVEW
ncbi:MAG: hypothetical protein GSR86_02640 [Desulfurococcales archaeon]|nr:hypothetical protein [Desulfurococcales archaeon]